MTVVEVVISAVLLVMISLAALGAIDAATRSSAEERHRSQANGLAQADEARLRSMRISDLANLDQTRTVTQDGTAYTVASHGEFVTDSTGTATCTAGTASADYIRTTSTVSWGSMGSRPPVVSESIVSPPSGSVAANRGVLAVQVVDGQSAGVEGVGLAGSGAGSFSGSTGTTGCAIFGDLPAGNYTLTPSGSSLVDKDGNPPAPQTTSVTASSTNTLALQYDHPGSIRVDFTILGLGGVGIVPSSADSVVVFNTGMTAAKSFGTPGSPTGSVTATPLFPFSSTDTVYAGTCPGDNPNPQNLSNPPAAAAMANVAVSPGNTATATIQLPVLALTAWSGTGALLKGSPVANAQVTVSDENCSVAGSPAKRTFTTNALGTLPDPGLPYGTYDVCVAKGGVHVTTTGVTVQDLTVPTVLDQFLGSSGATSGPCP